MRMRFFAEKKLTAAIAAAAYTVNSFAQTATNNNRAGKIDAEQAGKSRENYAG